MHLMYTMTNNSRITHSITSLSRPPPFQMNARSNSNTQPILTRVDSTCFVYIEFRGKVPNNPIHSTQNILDFESPRILPIVPNPSKASFYQRIPSNMAPVSTKNRQKRESARVIFEIRPEAIRINLGVRSGHVGSGGVRGCTRTQY